MRFQNLDLISDMYYQISKKWAQEWNLVNKHQLTVTQAIALNIIVSEGKQKSSTLANLLSITTGGVTGITDSLVKKGLIDRIRDGNDRRVVYLEITDLGKIAFEEHKRDRLQMMDRLFGVLNDEEVQALINIHAKLLRK